MEERPTRTEIIKILIQDRNHHFSHPHNIAVKFFYSLGGTVTTILIAFFVKNNEIPNLKEIVLLNSVTFEFFGSMIILGYILIFWGLGEHTAIHTNQRKRIESAIEYLILVKPEEFDFDIFWQKYGRINLKYSRHKKAKSSTSLIVAEPDSRNWINYHDRKTELGIIIILIGVVGLLTSLFM